MQIEVKRLDLGNPNAVAYTHGEGVFRLYLDEHASPALVERATAYAEVLAHILDRLEQPAEDDEADGPPTTTQPPLQHRPAGGRRAAIVMALTAVVMVWLMVSSPTTDNPAAPQVNAGPEVPKDDGPGNRVPPLPRPSARTAGALPVVTLTPATMVGGAVVGMPRPRSTPAVSASTSAPTPLVTTTGSTASASVPDGRRCHVVLCKVLAGLL